MQFYIKRFILLVVALPTVEGKTEVRSFGLGSRKSAVLAFSPPSFNLPLFTETPKLAPSKVQGTSISLPDFDELFGRIQSVSPFARHIINGGTGGLNEMDAEDEFDWKVVESNSNLKRPVQFYDKIDNFQEKNCPILRFRSTIEGPFVPERFAQLLMDAELRKKWDVAISQVYEAYPIYDLDLANIIIGSKYGDCSRMGVGYCQTKKSVVSPREQLTMCGIQDFENGGSIIWGTEMEDSENHLFPEGKRHVRARSHIFSTTLMPTGPNTFDVEYVLQLEIGGNIPSFMNAPVVSETVKQMFSYAKKYYSGGENGDLEKYINAKKSLQNVFQDRKSLLLPF